jgi:hypothetical protein
MLSVLLGAGASIDAGLPSANQLTDLIIQRFTGDARGLLQFIRRSMEGHRAITSRGLSDGSLDSESFFNTVSDLANRNNLEISPFVSAWHPALSQLRDEREQRQKATEGAVRRLFDEQQSYRTIRDLARLIANEVEIPEGILYNMKQAVIENIEMVTSVAYLAPLCRYADRHGQLTVATLNYDICIEKCCRDEGIEYSDGIGREWTSELKFNESAVQLIKLHGSASWDGQMGAPLRTATEATGRLPTVLFGGRNKLTAEWPYFDLFIHWRKALEVCTVLLVIGYSFRDDHVDATLRRWLAGNERRRIIIVDPSDIRKVANHPFRDEIRYESNVSDSNRSRASTYSSPKVHKGPPAYPRIVYIDRTTSEALTDLDSILQTWMPAERA